jgi:hypothetical protein
MRECGTLSNTGASSLCGKDPPRGIVWGWDAVYGAFIASIWNMLAARRIRVCASEKGNPVVRRGRKAQGLWLGGSRAAEQRWGNNAQP